MNDRLTSELLRIADETDSKARIALDDRRLMPAQALSARIEADYWFGPPLTSKNLDDPYSVGYTVHGDPQQGRGHEYPHLYVHWRLDKDGNKVLQMEELSDHPHATIGGQRALRYVHAIRDMKRQVFIHCDGAVRAYDKDAYASRSVEGRFPSQTRATAYRKVFRLDGEIRTDDWSSVVALWFRHNELVREYLAGLDEIGLVSDN